MIYQLCKTEANEKKNSVIIEKNLITLNYNFATEERVDYMGDKKETRSVHVFDTILVRGGEPTYETLVNFLIKTKYSDSEENALLRKKIANLDAKNEFEDYSAYCEECKVLATKLMESYKAFK